MFRARGKEVAVIETPILLSNFLSSAAYHFALNLLDTAQEQSWRLRTVFSILTLPPKFVSALCLLHPKL